LMRPVSACAVSVAARVLQRFDLFPITQDQIRMLMEGNACPVDDLVELGIEPLAFSADNLAYLNDVS
ncbi:MAG: complex I NDUFA9 subunit family protein, partial [Gammaproteobacteria bacterium]